MTGKPSVLMAVFARLTEKNAASATVMSAHTQVSAYAEIGAGNIIEPVSIR
ncbi:hypothetical protein [Chitinophaga agri]|uniref:Uncharacterized protein n=1 Tax=Chitinophaga agri TaxID=2703787 RepID=A0A6B9ZCB3_9BACT|nr:hypothetical protein [Chitinophaga agri]QHS58233.1 hypothetical protein GWR21_01075 [Chitinophaga agri]